MPRTISSFNYYYIFPFFINLKLLCLTFTWSTWYNVKRRFDSPSLPACSSTWSCNLLPISPIQSSFHSGHLAWYTRSCLCLYFILSFEKICSWHFHISQRRIHNICLGTTEFLPPKFRVHLRIRIRRNTTFSRRPCK